MSTLTKQEFVGGLIADTQKGFETARAEAKTSFEKLGLPSNRSEEYKFTAITKKLEQRINDFTQAPEFSISNAEIQNHLIDGFDGHILVFCNGYFQEEASSKEIGVEVKLLENSTQIPIGSVAKPGKDAFCALNQASFKTGTAISLQKKTKIEKPILLMNFFNPKGGQVIQPRLWIEGGDFAEVTFLEQNILLEDAPLFINRVIEIKGGENSHLHYYRLQNEGKNTIEVSNIETDIQRNSKFDSVTISLSGDMVRNNLSLNLLGSNSEGNMYGIYLLDGKSHVDNHTNVDHTIPHAESNELYKGILDGNSRGVFNGKIFVRQDAQKTNAFQQNNNILLSPDATVNTKPQLEIWADDVKCSHGCTTGQLDEEALFYLQARGIGKKQAKGLLLFAIAGEVLEHIKDDAFKTYCTKLVQDRLEGNF